MGNKVFLWVKFPFLHGKKSFVWVKRLYRGLYDNFETLLNGDKVQVPPDRLNH